MSPNPAQRRRYRLFWVLGAALAVWFTFFDSYSLLAMWNLNRQETRILREIERLEEDRQRMETDLERLRNDPFVLERIAREQYGMKRPDETVYIMPD